jgi:hypothetical protein
VTDEVTAGPDDPFGTEGASSGEEKAAGGRAGNEVNTSGRFSAFIKLLNDYKELITLLLFFIGGVIWLYVAFATKREVATLKCLLGTTIEVTENRVEIQESQKDMDRNLEVLSEYEAKKSTEAKDILASEKLK